MRRYVFLNPDGTEELGLNVIIEAQTGVTYGHQCGGYSTEVKTAEGFLIPLGGTEIAEHLARFFRDEFRGYPRTPDTDWTPERINRLCDMVSEIPCWLTTAEPGEDRRVVLELDKNRFGDCTEGWIPVLTAYGPGVLVFKNSD
jgi:hypothetical protein